MQAGTPAGAAYVLDRWTGGIRWVFQNEAEPVKGFSIICLVVRKSVN